MELDDVRRYQLVEFIDEIAPDGKKIIDCVPSQWISYDHRLGQLVTKFMPPPYTASKIGTLRFLTKLNQSAPENWAQYPVKIHGHASTYTSAQDRLETLRVENYAYSTDTEVEGGLRSCIITERFKKHQGLDDNFNTLPVKSGLKSAVIDAEASLLKESTGSEHSHSSDDDEPGLQKSIPQKKKLPNDNDTKKKVAEKIPKVKASLPSSIQPKSLQSKNADSREANNVPSTKSEKQQKSEFRTILATLESMRFDIQKLQREVKGVSDAIQTLGYNVITTKKIARLEDEYNVSFPIADKNSFEAFEEKLKDHSFRDDFTASLDILIDPDTSTIKNMSAILRKHFSRELAIGCTAVKPSGEKIVLKATIFFKCILRAFEIKNQTLAMKSPGSEKNIVKAVSSVLGNAKDWDGHRTQRANK